MNTARAPFEVFLRRGRGAAAAGVAASSLVAARVLLLAGLAAGCGQRGAVTDCAGDPPPVLADDGARLIWEVPSRRTNGAPLENLLGYRVFAGQHPARLRLVAEICSPDATEWVVSGLTPGTWYFALTAVDDRNVESELTNIVSKTIE